MPTLLRSNQALQSTTLLIPTTLDNRIQFDSFHAYPEGLRLSVNAQKFLRPPPLAWILSRPSV